MRVHVAGFGQRQLRILNRFLIETVAVGAHVLQEARVFVGREFRWGARDPSKKISRGNQTTGPERVCLQQPSMCPEVEYVSGGKDGSVFTRVHPQAHDLVGGNCIGRGDFVCSRPESDADGSAASRDTDLVCHGPAQSIG